MPTIAERRRHFRELHEHGCFLIPNPWDVGSARYLQHVGARALATTSAGLAFSRGLPDAVWAVPRDVTLEHAREITAATDVPVSADFQSGYARDPASLGENVRLCVETGIAGLSIEDATGDEARPLHDLDEAVARVRAARLAIDRAGVDVLLTARTECFLVGRPDLDEAQRRLVAYASAGADCLFAPGIRRREEIASVVQAVAPRPVNVLMSTAGGLTMAELAALGVRRVSVGGALARVAWGAFQRAAREVVERGTFDTLADAVPHAELNALFAVDVEGRRDPPHPPR
jgi:2-methylisocitrate lyase-like PEP mutase family enzyme